MMRKRKVLSLFLAGAMIVGLLAGCGSSKDNTPDSGSSPAGGGETAANEITVNFASEPESLDPARSTTVDGAVMINHLFEGLMRWENSGEEIPGTDGTCNNAVLGYGQAESHDVTTNDDGEFMIRVGLASAYYHK